MKKLLTLIAIALAVVVSSCSKFDDSAIWDKLNEQEQTLNDHEKRIAALEELCKQMNTNINALQTLVEALEKRDYITNVSPVREDGVVVGYTISFASSDTITIYNGKDGNNGTGGYTPQIGVKKDADGLYYWTLDGEWLLDDNGNKIKAVGEDGRDGQNGTDGTNGSNGSNGQDGTDGRDGVDGITPRLKIENNYWYVSYDEGATWIELGRATGEDGADGSDGSDGEDGDSIFSSVTQDEEYVYFNLADGTMITLPKHDKENIQFEDLQVKAICCKNWDTNNDGELSYAEAAAVTDIGTTFERNTDIISFTELKHFTGLSEISASAFEGCSKLWRISIPANISIIGEYAFRGCNIQYVYIYDIVSWCKIDFEYNYDSNPLNGGGVLILNGEPVTNLSLPENTTVIKSFAFYNCKSLTNVYIPNSVAIIGKGAFTGCSNVNYVHIGNGIAEFGGPCFSNCKGELICYSSIPDTANPTSTYSDTYGPFYGSKFNKVTFDDRAIKIGRHAFCTSDGGSGHSIDTLVINDSVLSIGVNSMGSVKNIYCKSSIPPQGSSDMFSASKIYVPLGCADLYKSATYWKNYASKIEEYDFENNPI